MVYQTVCIKKKSGIILNFFFLENGFTFTYKVDNPDVDAPNGKIYWVLTADNIVLTADEV